MFAPDFANDPEREVGANRSTPDLPKSTRSPEEPKGRSFDGSELSINGSPERPGLAEVLEQVPFKIRVLLRVARAEFSYPTDMAHLSHPEDFIRLAADRIFPGDLALTPVLCVGGFGTTGQGSFGALAEYLNRGGKGPTVKVVSLEGHTGSWDALRSTTWSDIIEGVLRHARELQEISGKPVATVALSTGGLGLLGALRREPGLFAPLNVAIGVPLDLRSDLWNLALKVFDRWESKTGKPELTDGFHIPNPSVVDEEGQITTPVFTRLPVRSLIAFHRLRCEAASEETLAAVSKRVVFLHGENDRLADPVGSRKLASRLENENLLWEPAYKKMGHNLLLSPVRDSVIQRVSALCAA